MPWRTRSCRAARSMSAMLPPWLLMMTSLRIPARCTLSPISMKARSAVSGESVSVPRNARCSSDAPTACTGRNATGDPPAAARARAPDTLARCRYRRRPADAARAAPPPQPAAPRCAREVNSCVVSESQSVTCRSVVVSARKHCQGFQSMSARNRVVTSAFAGRFRARMPTHYGRANLNAAEHPDDRNDVALSRRALIAASLALARVPASRPAARQGRRSAPTGSPRPSMAASIRRSPTAPTRNTAST